MVRSCLLSTSLRLYESARLLAVFEKDGGDLGSSKGGDVGEFLGR